MHARANARGSGTFDQQGLMAGVSIEGTKISLIKR